VLEARGSPGSAQGVEWEGYKQGKFFPFYSSEQASGKRRFHRSLTVTMIAPFTSARGTKAEPRALLGKDGGRPKTNAQHSLPVGRQRMGNSLKRPNVSRAPTYLQTLHKPTSTRWAGIELGESGR